MPAEWAPHRATWIAWPHHEPDWPGKLGSIPWVYAEIVRVLANHEQIEVLCHDAAVLADAQAAIDAHAVRADRVGLHLVPTDRVWLRDSAPTAAIDDEGRVVLVNWAFNGWAKYDNWQRDIHVGEAMARITGLARVEPTRPAGSPRASGASRGERIVLEGGGIEVNGEGLMLVTEEWLLSDVQVRIRASRAPITSGFSAIGSASRRRSGLAKGAWATTRTVTSTMSHGSSRRIPSCSRSKTTPPTRITRARSTISNDSSRWHAPVLGRCASSSFHSPGP
jgi:hypothetical protein